MSEDGAASIGHQGIDETANTYGHLMPPGEAALVSDEPLNIGAVVEDADGSPWVRTIPGVNKWANPWVGPNSEWRQFSDIRGPVTLVHRGRPDYVYSWLRGDR